MPSPSSPSDPGEPPLQETGVVEDWARDYILATELEHKLRPPAPPTAWATVPRTPIRHRAPGRPPELDLLAKTPRSVDAAKLANPRRRAQLLHTFLHHELQAAELMCWAILAFPETEPAFRRGLLGICQDEIRHMAMYRTHIEHLGFAVGAFPVRDWFWQRVATCATPVQFVALLGIGFEGGNLDHTRRFQDGFAAVGDAAGATLQKVVGDEEVEHVRFALHWFRTWTGELDFDHWRESLLPPLTPTMMKGSALDRHRRSLAGFPEDFLRRLEQWNQA